MEQLYYEARPYAFMIMAFAAPKLSHGSHFAMMCSVLLLLATSVILHARLVHRGVIAK